VPELPPPDTPVRYTPDWQAIKVQVLMRAWPGCGRCEWCGKNLPVDAHHRHLHGQGGPDIPQNLVAVCRECHYFIHANRVEAVGRGFIVDSWDANPAEVPVTLWNGAKALLDEHYGYQFTEWPDAA
jgi:HNH endonuclease